MKKLINFFFKKIGYRLTRIEKHISISNLFDGYDYATEGTKAIEICRTHSMMPKVNLQTLFEQAVYCEKNGIAGDFVECGVWKGGAVGVMAIANMKFGKQRRNLHLFDAFDDLCEPDPQIDGKKALSDMKRLAHIKESELTGALKPVKGVYDSYGGHGTINICNNLLVNDIGYNRENIIYHQGWFQDTLPKDADKINKIAILRLDGDWYESIKVCLEYLFDKVEKGGIIVIDDYGYYEGCTKAVDEFLLKRNIKTFLSYSNIGCRYFVKN
ncbi:MAG: TylF/MycF/NovP-related O-methyltransferase [Bacteroidota bacterium]|nr:TylF/MycF/NovP-related O-methyltransferase [Bacteroidota bacterium]